MPKFVRIFTFLCCAALLVAAFLHPISALNQDLGRHLLLGKIILNTGHIPTTNLFSYTYPNFPFINSHWLSEVVFFSIARFIGLGGLLIFTVSITLISFAIVFWTHTKKYSLIALAITTLSMVGILSDRTDIRPEVFSFLFVALFVVLLFKNRRKATKWIFLLPCMELLWVNMHIYFILGPLIVAFFLIDAFISEFLLQKTKHNYISLIACLILTCLATLCNPNGIHGAVFPLLVFQNYGYTIEENQTIFFVQSLFSDMAIVSFEVTAAALGLLLLSYWRKTRPIDWILFSFFTYIGIYQVRNMPLLSFAAFGILAECLDRFQTSFFTLIIAKSVKNIFLICFALVIVLLAIYEMNLIISNQSFGIKTDARAKYAVDFFKANHLSGPIFNNFDVGSYLIYRLYPEEKVFVDGRPEAYPAAFFQNTYIPMQQNTHVFANEDAKYKFNTIFFTITDATPWAQTFLSTIVKNPLWQMVYLDDNAVIFVKKEAASEQLLKKHNLNEKNFSLQNLYATDSKSLTVFSYFLDKLNWQKTEKIVLQKAISGDSSFCPALYQITTLFVKENNISQANLFDKQVQASCH